MYGGVHVMFKVCLLTGTFILFIMRYILFIAIHTSVNRIWLKAHFKIWIILSISSLASRIIRIRSRSLVG